MLPCSLIRGAARGSFARGGVQCHGQQKVRPSASAAEYCSSSSSSSSSSNGNSDGPADVFAPSNVLSGKVRDECVRRICRVPSQTSSADGGLGAKAKAKEAAILVPLCVVDGEVCLLFTLRSPHMSSHRGQVSFPGGMRDEEDQSFEATALRETEEELGIPREQVEIWGRCQHIESINRVNAVPVIGFLGHINLSKLNFNPKEVGEVFTMSLRHLCEKQNFRCTQFRTAKGYVLPVFLGGKYKVWGLTARVTHLFLSALLPSVYKNKLYYINPLKS